MRNNKGQTPEETFSADHEELSKKAKEAAKETANACMLVATLIATVVFPALLTVPGDGRTTGGYSVLFFFANATALFTASASALIFLTFYTSSWFNEDDSFFSLRRRLIFGLGSLVVSVYAMVMALPPASYVIFHQKDWAVYATCGIALPTSMALPYLIRTMFPSLTKIIPM